MAVTSDNRILAQGNEAIGSGAVGAGCLHFFGYPITPQNEVTEWFAREFPKRGGFYLQSEAENASAAMLFGASTAGVRVMTSTASPGWGLMQEVVSNIAGAELPCVIVNVQRGGPGGGSTQHAQMDYFSATRGGHGGYRTIVLAPASVQENCDFVQLGFYLADKYRIPVVVLTDAIIGQMMEPLEIKSLDFGPVPPKDWAVRGTDKKGGRFDFITSVHGIFDYTGFLRRFDQKHREIMKAEVRFETRRVRDAEMVIVAYGYCARVSEDVIKMARTQGLKVGMIRPITLWPFPYQAIRRQAARSRHFLVVEDSLGQLIDDVRLAVEGKAQVHLLGATARHLASASGMILPERVLEEVRRLL